MHKQQTYFYRVEYYYLRRKIVKDFFQYQLGYAEIHFQNIQKKVRSNPLFLAAQILFIGRDFDQTERVVRILGVEYSPHIAPYKYK